MTAAPSSDPVLFALTLMEMEGVGRVTAGRLLRHFATYEELVRYPREQVLARVKGAPNAADLVKRLFDREAMHARLAGAGAAVEALRAKHVTLFSMCGPLWPEGLDALPRAHRPVLLYGYGHREALDRPTVALLARPPITDAAFEVAQALTPTLAGHGVAPATGAAHGFDVVVHKRALSGPDPAPSLLVAHCGLARLPARMRPTASAVVRAGGLLLSPFPMTHGPYEHDDRERALVLAALARAVVFFEPRPGAPEWTALEWALETGKPVFGVEDPDHPMPERVHRLHTDVDFEWILAALRA
ncbi:DNA-processing protein DprA [Rhodocaloribacter sp.]